MLFRCRGLQSAQGPNRANPCEISRRKCSLLKFGRHIISAENAIKLNAMWQHCTAEVVIVVITTLERQMMSHHLAPGGGGGVFVTLVC
jgi:hypothetical protein